MSDVAGPISARVGHGYYVHSPWELTYGAKYAAHASKRVACLTVLRHMGSGHQAPVPQRVGQRARLGKGGLVTPVLLLSPRGPTRVSVRRPNSVLSSCLSGHLGRVLQTFGHHPTGVRRRA